MIGHQLACVWHDLDADHKEAANLPEVSVVDLSLLHPDLGGGCRSQLVRTAGDEDSRQVVSVSSVRRGGWSPPLGSQGWEIVGCSDHNRLLKHAVSCSDRIVQFQPPSSEVNPRGVGRRRKLRPRGGGLICWAS